MELLHRGLHLDGIAAVRAHLLHRREHLHVRTGHRDSDQRRTHDVMTGHPLLALAVRRRRVQHETTRGVHATDGVATESVQRRARFFTERAALARCFDELGAHRNDLADPDGLLAAEQMADGRLQRKRSVREFRGARDAFELEDRVREHHDLLLLTAPALLLDVAVLLREFIETLEARTKFGVGIAVALLLGVVLHTDRVEHVAVGDDEEFLFLRQLREEQ